MKERSSKIPVIAAVLQSVLAVGAWLLWGLVVYLLGPGIDFEKPNHQVTLTARFQEATLTLGLPILWSTSAAILIWRRSALGWWLCVLGDSFVAMFGLAFVITDLPQLAKLKTYPALYPEMLYHLALFLLPVVAMVLLFSRPMRPWPAHLSTVSSETDA